MAAIASRELSAREYLNALLSRVERCNPTLNAIVTIDERALAAAAAADEATVRGQRWGPLHGVAMTVKDSLATAGVRTTSGSQDLVGYVPDEDCPAVAALRRGGAIVFGKTNLAECAADVQTHNEVFGTTANPWHPDHTAGGSSGGSAAAVAAGLTPLEVGSDIAGSIRIPAANCGVFAHKPTFGIVPTQGHVPPHPQRLAVPDMAVVGPLARTAEDLALALSTLVGPAPADAVAWRVDLPPARESCRLAVWYDDPAGPVDRDVLVAMSAAVRALRDAGYRVVEDRPEVDFATAVEVFRRLLAGIAAGTYGPADIENIGAGRRRPGPELGAQFVAQRYVEWKAAHEAREVMRAAWARFFTRYEAILLPVAPTGARRHDHRALAQRSIVVNGQARPYWDQTDWAGLTGLALLPTTIVPAGRDSAGLPVGLAVTGPYLGDRTTLRLAAEFSGHLAPIGRPPILCR